MDRRLSARLWLGAGTCGVAGVLSLKRPSGSDRCERLAGILAVVETTLYKCPFASRRVPMGPRGIWTAGGFSLNEGRPPSHRSL